MFMVTFIRHGESEDNLKSVWAGWKDAPLSDLGVKQAAAVGQSFSSTPISIIYASPLKRAYSTALAVQQNQSVQPRLISNPNLREQHFGIAEGHLWVNNDRAMVEAAASPNSNEALQKAIADLAAQGIFPQIPTRALKFPEGESMDDLGRRAEQALRECILLHFAEYIKGGCKEDVHVVVVSHGLCISEIVAALVRLDPQADRTKSYKGLLNTAWTRAVISARDGLTGSFDILNPSPLEVKVTHFNDTGHLETLDTIGSVDLDDARKFFSGASTTSN